MGRLILSGVLAFFTALCVATAGAAEPENVELTVYNHDLGLVKEVRTLDLQKGLNEVRLEDVAAQLDPTSVTLVPIQAGTGTFVQEQNFEYDLASDAKLLFRYIGQPITVLTKEGKLHQGILIAGVDQNLGYRHDYDPLTGTNVPRPTLTYSYGNLVLAQDREKGPITIIQRQDNIREIELPSLPAGLITKPTLMWQMPAEKAGAQKCQLTYLTKGMEWRADYALLLNADDTRANVSGWVTLDNRSGKTFEDARVKLMAGDVATDQQARQRGQQVQGYAYGQQAEQGPSQDTRQVFEYHMYGIEHPTTVRDNQTKQVKLLGADNVPVTKFYVYDGAQFGRFSGWDAYSYRENNEYGTECNKKVMVFVELVNTSTHGLGLALPRGKVRLFKQDQDKSVQFIGEDTVDHTPANELVRVRVGEAFDLVGERKQTDFQMIVSHHIYDESFEIAVRNQKKDEPVEVRVVEHLYRWSDWTITQSSQASTKTDSRTAEFRVKVPAGGEQKITYTVRYNW